jgi:LysM repeat protein
MAEPLVLSAMAKAVSNLYTSVPVHPRDMFERQLERGYIPGDVPLRTPKAREQPKRHTVRKGDTLSEIAKRYRVTTKDLARANSIRDADKIRIGQVLKMPEPRHHMHAEGEEHQRATESLLAGQVVDPDSGKDVDAGTVGKFGQLIVKRNGVQKEVVRGADGQKRAVSRLKFSLAEKHLQIRAQRYYPLVESSAQRFDLDTALIMAMVHTESAFNPMAASRAKAYGLMQLIPSQGGKDAYRWLYGRNQEPSRSYLMQPRENVELGTAYMKILGDKVFSKVTNPRSRLYCSVAAYNAGSRNVGKTFTGRKSVQASVGTINSMSPEQVYQRLKTSAPSRETREYVKQVFERTAIYRTPAWPPLG